MKLLAGAAWTAILLGLSPVQAQDQPPPESAPAPDVTAAPDSTDMPAGMPRDIVPSGMIPESETTPESPPEAATPGTPAEAAGTNADMPELEAMPSSVPMLPLGGAVQVGDLGDVEGPIAGTLSDSEGLGADEWQGADRAVIETMLKSVPPATPSDTGRLLMRRVLLTAAPPPAGRADIPFNALRIEKLLDAGLADDAADLAEKIDAPKNADILRAQADAFLYAGRDADACSNITAKRLDSAEPFWAELRAYCYATAGDTGPLDLTRSVLTEQGLADPAFLSMLDAMLNGMPQQPEALPIMDSLHVRMLSRLALPMNAQIATGMGLTASLIAANSQATPTGLRVAAAEMALRAGVLPTPLLASILDLQHFDPKDLVGAPALARGEGLMPGLARLRAALKAASWPMDRAEIVHTAFEIGERNGLLLPVALLFGDDAAAIMPAPDWSNWSDLMMRGLLLAGRPDAAARWYGVLASGMPSGDMAALADQLQLVLALSAPNVADPTKTNDALLALANAANPKPPPPPEMPEPMVDPMTGAPVATPVPPPPPLPPKPPESLVARATLDLGLFDATGRGLPMDAQDSLAPLMKQESKGRRPPPALMARIDQAALAGGKGEVALSVVAALGQTGAGDLAPDAVVKLVRALKTAGLSDAAQALALEALLLRPGGGVNG